MLQKKGPYYRQKMRAMMLLVNCEFKYQGMLPHGQRAVRTQHRNDVNFAEMECVHPVIRAQDLVAVFRRTCASSSHQTRVAAATW
jgi:hypothetical protein